MNINIRTTKFPYVFWSFNKAYLCELDFKKQNYLNLELENATTYSFKAFNTYAFLSLKYLPILLMLFICFTRYDFYLNERNIIAYTLAFLVALSVNFLENLLRQIISISLLVCALIIGFVIEDIFLLPYVLKYFILLSILLLFALDLRQKCFAIYDEKGKVITHFLMSKAVLREIV
ncbi:hypothetical protein [Campylobacter helveticus]|uniref:hypothetical protein n=1 Tax=Campylobacter helveticus TaxID=28898 RepID=UPI00214A7004|nr:hypothetical protein [Campylobacter helveticus]MCR2062055.1 hypothetical protein [Campylobacter helveticus]